MPVIVPEELAINVFSSGPVLRISRHNVQKFASCLKISIGAEMAVIRCTHISISVTKCPLALLVTTDRAYENATDNLRTFARKISNADFFLQILPLKDDELVMSEM